MSLSAGSRLGAYEILALIGAGAMGEVYRARDTRLKREIAIKVLPDSWAFDVDRLARFQREAELLATLNHPNIAAIYGLEEADGGRALLLELVEGPTLADRLQRGPFPQAEALAIARQVAVALDAAHERGIVHRDLKPANIKLRTDGTVKVLDFGLAKTLELEPATTDRTDLPTMQNPAMTQDGVVLGTPAYMSPEQARGLAIDKRADIWAFGCVLYEVLTGRAVFARDTIADTLSAIVVEEPDWSALPPATPDALRWLIQRCLEKDLKRRLRDIGDAVVELEDSGSGRSASVSERPSNRYMPRQAQRLAGLGIVVIGAAALAAWQVTREPVVRSPAAFRDTIVSQLTNYDGAETGAAIAPDGRSFVFVSSRQGNPDIWLRRVSGGEAVRLTDDDAIESDLVFAHDGESVYYTRSAGGDTSIWRVAALGGQPRKVLDDARAPSPSADGRRLAWFTRESEESFALVVAAIDGNGRRELLKGIQPVVNISRASWSPDGQFLAYTSGGLFAPRNLFVMDASDGRVRQVTRFERGTEGPRTQTWLPDSRHLVMSYFASPQAQGAADLGILDSATGAIVRITTNVSESLDGPSLSSDGTRLIVTSSRPMREVWKVPFGPDPLANGRQAVQLLDASVDPMWTFLTRDGRTLLFNNALVGSRNLWTMPLGKAAEARQITSVAGNAVMHSSLSPDGTSVAFASITAGNSDIWVQNVDGSNLQQLTSDPAADAWPVWAPDGRSIIFGSLRDGAWVTRRVSPAGGSPENLIDGFFRGDWIARPDGMGTLIVTAMLGGGVRLLDGERRDVIWRDTMPGNGTPIFSPDGRSVSVAYRETRDRDAIWVYDVATGSKRIAVRFPQQFHISFRANWVGQGQAFVVNRIEGTSHVVLFEHFWTGTDRSTK
jgi:Tol biopolymer transport system component